MLVQQKNKTDKYQVEDCFFEPTVPIFLYSSNSIGPGVEDVFHSHDVFYKIFH